VADLSVVIPARKEEWLNRTVADVLEHATADTEVIVVLDGDWPAEPLPQHPKLHVVYLPKAIGQRAATNLGVRLSSAPYVMKLDAHCSFPRGFDTVLLEAAKELGPGVMQIPAQKNLHVYDWVCQDCGRREYQCGLTACRGCNSANLTRDVIWKPKPGVHTKRWRFDADLHFQYWGGADKGEFTETMSFLGACCFVSRAQWEAIGGLDEDHGSWGQFGTELSCKVWLSGGRVVTNNRTWFAHFFRVGGQQFPYPITGSQQEYARKYSQNLWRGNHWPGQVLPLRWLVDKFWPVPGWTEEQRDALPIALLGVVLDSVAPMVVKAVPAAGIVYYTDNRLDPRIAAAVRGRLDAIGLSIVAVSLQPLNWPGVTNIVLERERGHLTMFLQQLAGLEASKTDLVYFCEHDALYHASHFHAEVPDRHTVSYNAHVWKVDAETGRALHYRCNQTSGLCGYREHLVNHYRARVQRVSQVGYSNSMGFEPGTRQVANGGFDDYGHVSWMSEVPIVDIRHGQNLTPSRWAKDQFKNQRYTEGWTESDSVPGWSGKTSGRFNDWLAENSVFVHA
jgi:glycosyltransferase involved in cell wall biosynthesis